MDVDSNFMSDDVVYYNIPGVTPRSPKRSTVPSSAETPPVKCKRNNSSGSTSAINASIVSSDNTTPPLIERKSKNRRSSFYMWWKRKRRSSCSPSGTPTSIRNVKENVQPVNSDFYAKMTPESSSETTTVPDSSDISGESYVKVLGGVSYVKREPKPIAEYQNIPIDSFVQYVPRVTHWQKQARWLCRRSGERKHRKKGDESIDIGIIYSEADGTQWAQFIEKDLSNLLSSNSGYPLPRIEMLKVDTYAAAKYDLVVQESMFKGAKLQIAIISPCMVSLLTSRSDLKLDRLFNPKRVMALLLNVTPRDIYDNATLASAFCSFEEWVHMDVKDRNLEFVCSVRDQVLQLLIGCDAYSGFSVTKNFSLRPRKVSKLTNEVIIHLQNPVKENSTLLVTLNSKQSDREKTGSVKVSFHNPYNLSFSVPEKYLKSTSCLLYVYVSIDKQNLGWRELKCEGSLEILVTALETVADPIEVMTQALGISKIQGSLDSVLASRLKKNLPLQLLTDATDSMEESNLPTWLHFGAHYGLMEFCCTLLHVPGSKQISNCRNSHGDNPAVLAFKAGFIDLAKILENYAFNSFSDEMNSYLHLDETRLNNYPDSLDYQWQSPVPSFASTPEGSFVRQTSEGSLCLQKSDSRFGLQKSDDSVSLRNSEGSFSLHKGEGGYNLQKSEGSFVPRILEDESTLQESTNSNYQYKNPKIDESTIGTYVDMKKNSCNTLEWKESPPRAPYDEDVYNLPPPIPKHILEQEKNRINETITKKVPKKMSRG